MECLLADKTFNATNAARKAGYKAAPQAANKLMKQPTIAAAIGKAIQERMEDHKIDAAHVFQELCHIAFSNPKNLLDEHGAVIALKDLPDEVAVCVSSMRVSYTEEENDAGRVVQIRNVELKFWDKLEALTLVARHLGMFDDRLKSITNVNVSTSSVPPMDFDRLCQAIESMSDDDLIEGKVVNRVGGDK